MSKEELLKYLIAEIDLIMHDKDYRFENANGTWYSRESCRDLTNEEVFEELRTELRQFADIEAKLAEKEKENLTLFSMLYETLEKQGCENIASTIEQMTNLTLEKQSNWFKGNCVKDQDKIDLGRIGIVLNRQHKEIEELKKQVQEKDLLYKSLLAMATQLNDVYDTEGCMYGDKISGDTPEETANAYIEETKKKLKEKNNEKNNS